MNDMANLYRKRHGVGWSRWWWAGSLCVVWMWTWPHVDVRESTAAQVLDGIAAVVNDEIITISEVREAMHIEAADLQTRYRGSMLEEKLQGLYQYTLQPMIDFRLQLARAQELKVEVTEAEVEAQIAQFKEQNQISDAEFEHMLASRGITMEAYRKQIRDNLLISRVVNIEVRSRLAIEETELREVYRQQQEKYSIAGEVTVSHILFLVPERAREAEDMEAKRKAEAILTQLRAGGDFETLATKFSDGPSAERGGLLGTFRTGELLPGFEEAIASLQPGQVSDVVRTRIGWHIIRLEERKDGDYQPFEAVREELRASLLRTKTEKKYGEWVASLRQQAYITILHQE
jgi:peptidyl-prolyl cis-trans isomerase SurA